jgi:hypothetical protein
MAARSAIHKRPAPRATKKSRRRGTYRWVVNAPAQRAFRPSSPELKTRIASFIRRVDNVLLHPLADSKGPFTLNVAYDQTTGTIVGGELLHNNMPKPDLVYLATEMRPLIFATTEKTHVLKLTAQIEEEHSYFRNNFDQFRSDYERWTNRLIIGVQEIGTVPKDQQSDSPQLTSVWSAPAGTPFPDGTDIESMSTDFYFAKVYFYGEFYGEVWHSDDTKAALYESATPFMQRHMAKCAELRTLSAISFLGALRGWILQARETGADL